MNNSIKAAFLCITLLTFTNTYANDTRDNIPALDANLDVNILELENDLKNSATNLIDEQKSQLKKGITIIAPALIFDTIRASIK